MAFFNFQKNEKEFDVIVSVVDWYSNKKVDGLHPVPKLRKPAVEVSAFAQFVLNSQLNRLPFTRILNYRGLDFVGPGGMWIVEWGRL